MRAAAESFKGIEHLVVLNGAEGMNGMLTQVMGAGIAGVSMFKNLLGGEAPGNSAASTDDGKPVPATPPS